MNTSGFYKLEEGVMHYAPNRVYHYMFFLSRDDPQSRTCGYDGWQWFDSDLEAYQYHNIALPEKQVDEV